MNSTKISMKDLVHDFQADLNGILGTIDQVKKHLKDDPQFCEKVIELASARADRILARWDELKSNFKETK